MQNIVLFNDQKTIFQNLLEDTSRARLPWEPAVWFNAKHINY